MVGRRVTPQIAFGQVLRLARTGAGMSQEKLALEAGIERNFVSLIETGQNQPTITTLFKLAEALQRPARELIEETQKRMETSQHRT